MSFSNSSCSNSTVQEFQWSKTFCLRELVQTHVILTILRVCWGWSVLKLLTPDLVNPRNLLNPVNPLKPAMNSQWCVNHLFLWSKRALTSPNHHAAQPAMNCQVCKNHLSLVAKAASRKMLCPNIFGGAFF